MSEALATRPTAELSTAIEQVVVEGDLSRLSPEQRVDYYRTVCQSMGLNPYTRPFDYIRLNNKLTLYARKDATDQLRKIHGVNIDDITQGFEGDWFVVTVKGSDRTGRRDVEVGVVNKKDMQGNLGNAMMKAVTKAKRRLTLSLCGLGWLDETEVETVRDAQPVIVDDSGNIVERTRNDSKPVPVIEPINNTPKQEKPVEAQEEAFNEVEWLRAWSHKPGLPPMTLQEACAMKDSKGREYGTMSVTTLYYMQNAIMKKMPGIKDPATRETYQFKLSAINEIFTAKSNAQKELDKQPDPFMKGAENVEDEI